MRIRRAELRDAGGIARVQVDGWRSTYRGIIPDEFLHGMSYERSQRNWETDLAPGSKSILYVAEEDRPSSIIGFVAGGPERTNDPIFRGEVYAIYVAEERQRSGTGRRLVSSVVKDLRSLGFDSMLVWVLADNPSRLFYERIGGKRVRTKEVTIGGKVLEDLAYGWTNLDSLATS